MSPWFLDTFFPRRCVVCGAEGVSWVCQECQWRGEDWPREAYPGILALAPFRESVIRESIHGLKYHSLHELAEELVTMVWPGDRLQVLLNLEVAELVPVPTSFSRRKRRGYNQAELIARAFGRRLGWSVRTDLLVKTARGSQVGKSRTARLSAGYALRASGQLPTCPLVLVDDLCTTGSTIAACRKALGKEVPAIVLAMD